MGGLDPVVISETKRVSLCNLCLTALENIVFVVMGKWNVSVLLGSLFGWLIATACFVSLGISVQKAVVKEQKEAQLYMQKTYMFRNLFMAVGIVAAIKLPGVNWVAAIFPLFFTRISITLLNTIRKKEE